MLGSNRLRLESEWPLSAEQDNAPCGAAGQPQSCGLLGHFELDAKNARHGVTAAPNQTTGVARGAEVKLLVGGKSVDTLWSCAS
jgi:hypothetical protein